jgi:predicted dehydrogenase
MSHHHASQKDSLSTIHRRDFIRTLGMAAAGSALAGCQSSRPRSISANEKLNIGFIGTAGQAGFSIDNLKGQNIVALCDVDATNLAKAAQQFPSAQTYRDFRRLIDQKGIDAIVVATPDHTHAVATAAALRTGRHVYCEKPLTHTVGEARAITELARRTKLVTQIGTQIHAGNNYRRVVELVQSGAIGAVREVHVWVNSSYGGQAVPAPTAPIPVTLDWDLWVGPVASRPYSPEYVPFKWRNWWAFGGGSLADFGCHFMDLPFWALGLKYPTSIEPLAGPPVNAEATPPWLIVRYQFPERPGTKNVAPAPGVSLTWYHGGRRPEHLISDELYAKWKGGVLFVGDKGMLLADYGRHTLLPDDKFKDFSRPKEFIANSIGHHQEWVQAIKTGGTPTCHFGYSGPLTETALLGNIAYRVGQKIEWDSINLRARNCPAADELVQYHYRAGWKL